jgi:glycosyltransferase involved in cell wall biosynthesis
MPSPFVSFCFTTYKRHDHLLNTLESIRKQSFTDFEVIVSDNDPEGSGRKVVEGFNDTRFKYYANAENLGMIKSFNNSLEKSSGEYIVMIADDDPVYPDMLETLIKLKNEYPGYGMYLGGCDWFCTNASVGKLYGIKVGTNSCLSNDHDLNYTKTFTPDEFVKDLFKAKIFQHYLWSVGMVRRDILIEKGGIPDYGTPFLGDYAYISVMGSHSGCVVINKSLGCQTLHSENFGRKQNEQLVIAAKNFSVYLDSKMPGLKDGAYIKELIHKFLAVWLISHMSFLHTYGDNKDGSLSNAEKEIFSMEFMKKYKFKYFLKRRFPVLHNQLVSLKQKLK